MKNSILQVLKRQNKTSIIKTSFIVVICVMILMSPNYPIEQKVNYSFRGIFNYGTSIFVFGALAIPLLLYLNKVFIKLEITQPKWTDNPFTLRKPLIPWQFISITAIGQGFCLIMKDLAAFGSIQHHVHVQVFSIGLGTFTGIYITLLINNLLKRKK